MYGVRRSDRQGGHYTDVIMGAMASQITSLTIVYSTVYSDANQRKYQSSASLAFVRGNWPGTGEFPTQMASDAENASIGWRHHGPGHSTLCLLIIEFCNQRAILQASQWSSAGVGDIWYRFSAWVMILAASFCVVFQTMQQGWWCYIQ